MTLALLYYSGLPFWWALSPLPGIDLSLGRLIVPVLFLWWLARSLVTRRMILAFPGVQWLFSGWLLWCLASAGWAWEASWAFRKGLFLANFLLLVPVLLALPARSLRRILEWWVWGAVLAAGLGVCQFWLQFVSSPEHISRFWTAAILPFFLGEAFGQAVAAYPSLLANIGGSTYLRASALFPDPHLFALYLGMALPVALGFWWRGKLPAWAPGLLLAGNLLAFSRGAYVALLGTFCFAAIVLAWRRGLLRQGGVLLLAGLALVALAAGSPVGERFASSFSPLDGSNQERLRLWEEAARNIPAAFWHGQGLGNYPLFLKPEAGSREPIYAHNLYLDLWLEVGLIGLLLFLVPFGFAWRKGWRGYLAHGDWLLFGALFSLMNFFLHAFFETPIFSVHILPALLLVWAFVLKAAPQPDTNSPL